MRLIEYYHLSIKKDNQIWLIPQGGIVIPIECVFVDKMTLGPGTLKVSCSDTNYLFSK